ncbi:MAG: DegT/DnrJ/EryC1/StrS family aminotransferase [Burkholderiaceae bacterium]
MTAQVLFERLAPIPPAYPKPWFPMLPVLGRTGAALDPVRPASRFLERDARFTATGAAAILLALRDAGVGAGDRVVVPAYHCPTMVFPVLAIGAEPLFVPIEDDLSLRVDRIDAVAEPRTRAVLLPHFFGFAQPQAQAILTWCRAWRAVLIEDCAHAFYGIEGGFVPGRIGDYAIASTRKFFAGTEGGALVANRRTLRTRLPGAPWRLQARSLVDTLHLAARIGNLPMTGRGATAPGTGELDGPADAQAALDEARAQPAGAGEIEASTLERGALLSTVAFVRGANHARSAAVRRARYARWKARLDALPGVRALRDDDPHSGAPYVFPALLEDPQRQFARLKYAGVQVWRWDRLARSECSTSRRLAIELVQLPCQQSLDDARFDALLDAFSEAVSR